MLNELDPGQLVEMWAAKETIPLDDGWRQADTIAGAVHDEHEFDRQCAAGKKRLDKTRLHKPGSYIPQLRERKKNKIRVNQASIDAAQAVIASHCGF